MKKEALKRELKYEIMILPALILFCLFIVYPTVKTFYYSFTNWSDYRMYDFTFIGLNNYKKLFTDELILAGIKNSLKYAILMTIFQNILAIPLAVFLDKNLRTKKILRAAFFMPAVFSTLIVGYLWNFIFSPSDFGLLNSFLKFFSLPKTNILGNPQFALYGVLITQVWQWTGWNMVIFLANLQTIPQDYYEAARIDGASSIQTFWKITLPLLAPAATFCIVTSMIGGLKVFDIVYALTGGGPGFATETILSVMIKRGFNEGFYGYTAAYGIVFLFIVCAITIVILKLLRKWEERVS